MPYAYFYGEDCETVSGLVWRLDGVQLESAHFHASFENGTSA